MHTDFSNGKIPLVLVLVLVLVLEKSRRQLFQNALGSNMILNRP
jgi:hypothetical protein